MTNLSECPNLDSMTVIESTPTAGVIPTWTLADRLTKARQHAGFDQAELAERIGISRPSASAYEKGKTVPRRPVILSWALATGVSLDWIMTGAESTDSGPTDPSGQVSRSSLCMTDNVTSLHARRSAKHQAA